MPSSNTQKPKRRRSRRRTPKITIRHLTNSLAQIELWVNAVRVALSGLNPNVVLPLGAREGSRWSGRLSPIRIDKDCPPPE